MNYLCFDIGGTFIKYGLFNEKGEALGQTQKVKTSVDQYSNQILQQVLSITKQVQSQESLSGVAISTAGVVDSRDGSIRFAGPTIPGYTGTPLKVEVEALTGLPCYVVNDVNAACLGEYWQASRTGQPPKSMICFTIGTGVGGAVVLDGQLLTGVSDMAGEVGYLPIGKAAFQELASTTALLEQAAQATGENLSGEAFFDRLVATGDPVLSQVLDQFLNHLATGLLSAIYLLNPEVLVLGGGILARADLIMPRLMAILEQRVIDPRFLTTEIRPAQSGNDAGMLGALSQLIKLTQ